MCLCECAKHTLKSLIPTENERKREAKKRVIWNCRDRDTEKVSLCSASSHLDVEPFHVLFSVLQKQECE